MSAADPETFVRYMNKLDTHMGRFNKVVAGLTRVIDKNIRAQTKVIAMASKTKGMMLGVVADLDLMGGAFGKVKKGLVNLLGPINQDTPKLFKFLRGVTSISGAFETFINPLWATIKATKAKVAALHEENAILNKVTEADQQRANIMSQVAKFEFPERLVPDPLLTRFDPTVMEGILESSTAISYAAMPRTGVPPSEFMGRPAPMASMAEGAEGADDAEGMEEGAKDMKSGKMKKAMSFWKDNVTNPVKQIAAGGVGLGFQSTIVMGLMQAFAGMFTIFQPIIDVVGGLIERLSVGFMPLIEMIMEILTSPPVLAMIDMLADVLAEVFEMFRPLVPIIISLIEMAMEPLSAILEALMPVIEIIANLFATIMVALMPLIQLIIDALIPIFPFLAKVIGILIVAGMYPLIGSIYIVGLAIAGLMDLFTLGAAGAIESWNNMILPIFDALNQAMYEIAIMDNTPSTFIEGGEDAGGYGGGRYSGVHEYQHGTDYVPYTGIFHLTRGERVITAEDNRSGRGGGQHIVINIDGGIWVQDLDDFVNTIGRKLSLYR